MQNVVREEIEKLLSEKSGEPVEIYSTNSIGGGCINNASKIETSIGSFFVKWNSNCQPDIFTREAESLSELKTATGDELKVPEVYASKEVNTTPGFLVLEYLAPGYSAFDNDEKLGRGLALIHRYSKKNFGFYTNNYCGATLQDNSWKSNWAEFFRNNRLYFLLDLIQKERPLPSSEIKIYEKLLEKIPELVPDNSEPVLIHGDLWSGNYMICKTGPALIDPCAYYADPEMEFAIMTMFGGFSQRFYAAYNEVNPLLPDWRQRNSLYQIYHILNHYYLFGGGYQSQAIRVARSFI
jgi:fructosamine-3-kinase